MIEPQIAPKKPTQMFAAATIEEGAGIMRSLSAGGLCASAGVSKAGQPHLVKPITLDQFESAWGRKNLTTEGGATLWSGMIPATYGTVVKRPNGLAGLDATLNKPDDTELGGPLQCENPSPSSGGFLLAGIINGFFTSRADANSVIVLHTAIWLERNWIDSTLAAERRAQTKNPR